MYGLGLDDDLPPASRFSLSFLNSFLDSRSSYDANAYLVLQSRGKTSKKPFSAPLLIELRAPQPTIAVLSPPLSLWQQLSMVW
jgi:hypothetical protein